MIELIDKLRWNWCYLKKHIYFDKLKTFLSLKRKKINFIFIFKAKDKKKEECNRLRWKSWKNFNVESLIKTTKKVKPSSLALSVISLYSYFRSEPDIFYFLYSFSQNKNCIDSIMRKSVLEEKEQNGNWKAYKNSSQ